jgi:hypothetical protein
MFVCPKCREQTISLGAKISGSIFRPIPCSSCGSLFVVSRAAVAGALAVAELATVPLLFVAPRLPFATFLSLVVAVFLLGCIYSYGFAPLERLAHAEPEPRWTWTGTNAALVVMLLIALSLIPIYAIFRL